MRFLVAARRGDSAKQWRTRVEAWRRPSRLGRRPSAERRRRRRRGRRGRGPALRRARQWWTWRTVRRWMPRRWCWPAVTARCCGRRREPRRRERPRVASATATAVVVRGCSGWSACDGWAAATTPRRQRSPPRRGYWRCVRLFRNPQTYLSPFHPSTPQNPSLLRHPHVTGVTRHCSTRGSRGLPAEQCVGYREWLEPAALRMERCSDDGVEVTYQLRKRGQERIIKSVSEAV